LSVDERIWPAFQTWNLVRALAAPVNWAQEELLPIAIAAPADRKTRDGWLARLWLAIEDDGVDYLLLSATVGRAVRFCEVALLGRPVFSAYCASRGPILRPGLCARKQHLPLEPAGCGPAPGTFGCTGPTAGIHPV